MDVLARAGGRTRCNGLDRKCADPCGGTHRDDGIRASPARPTATLVGQVGDKLVSFEKKLPVPFVCVYAATFFRTPDNSWSSITGTISIFIKSFQAKANSVNARGSSLSSKSYPWLKSSRVQRPRSLAPLGGCPPVFRKRAMASLRFVLSGVVVNVSMNFISPLLFVKNGFPFVDYYGEASPLDLSGSALC